MLSAENVHAMVELKMKEVDLLNFEDFSRTVERPGGPHVIRMEAGDFCKWYKKVSASKKAKVRLLVDLKVIEFCQNLFKM